MHSNRKHPKIPKTPVLVILVATPFVSQANPTTSILFPNTFPLKGRPAALNFYEFGDDVLYEIKIDNDGDGVEDITYQFRFETELRNPNTFLYNTGRINSLNDPNWNKRQFYSVTRVKDDDATLLGSDLASPPCN